jgi:hypothetical protein
MNLIKKLQLRIFGCCIVDGKYFINCEVHGVQPAREYSYDSIICEKCLDDLVSDTRVITP